MSKKELQEKIYSMSNSFLPLDVFYNDIRDNNAENYDKEQAYKDIEIIADFIIDLQQQLDQQKAMYNELKEFIIKKQEEYQADIVEQEMQGSIPNPISFYARYNLCNEIQKKIQELEAKDVKD